jgi:type II secretory ATPase GspE/PulE/Tfp pilus assembly ATPase PilB-like protein
MTITLAVDVAVPFSLVKPVIGFLVLLAWAHWATVVDKDGMYLHQNRRMWNAVQLAAGMIGFAAILLIPLFFVGLLLSLLVMGGAAGAYVFVRNKVVHESKRWRLDGKMLQQMVRAKREEMAARKALLKFSASPGTKAGLKPVPLHEDPQYHPHLLLEELLEPALRRHAQKIKLSGNESQFLSQLTVDGVEYKQGHVAAPAAVAMIDYLKAHCGMDVADRRRKQAGKCQVEIESLGQHDLRVLTAGSTQELTCTILIDPVMQLTFALKDMGLLEPQLEKLKPVLASTRGAVLVASPPHHGRTTTLYALATGHDPYTMDIHTIETGVERELEGVTQQDVEPANMPKALQSLLLKDPHVVLVSQVADQQTARLIAGAAAEGHRVYAGIKADDSFTALKLWLKAAGEPADVASGLSAIVAQRLVRKLCTFCRQKYKPEAAALRKLNLPADRIPFLYKAGGKIAGKRDEPCPACSGVGYSGRIGAFEVMVIDDEAREILRTGNVDALRTHLRRQRMLWLEEAALARVVDGTTSISEVMRALGHEQASPVAANSASGAGMKPAE